MIGVTGLSEFSLRDRRAVVGHLARARVVGDRGQPPVEGARAGARLPRPGLERVTAWCGTDNGRSQKALERLGFVHEGVLRRWHVHRGEPEGRDQLLDAARGVGERASWRSEPVEIVGEVPVQFKPL